MPRVTITIKDQSPQPYRFPLDRTLVTIGRASENDIAVSDGSVSVHHAEMIRDEDGYRLVDLGSTNGTKQNGARVESVELVDGIRVELGDVIFGFELSEEEQAAISKGPKLPPVAQAEPEKEKEKPEPSEGDFQPVAKPRAAGPARPAYYDDAPRSGSNALMTLLFLILAAAALFIGLSIRHKKDTGRSLLQDMKQPQDTEAPAAK